MPIAINSRILLSVASIAAAVALVIGATFAFFSDEETSTDNIFAAGTLDLVLCEPGGFDEECPGPEGEGPEDGTTATFGDEDMAPGGDPVSGTLTLRNAGSIDSNHVDLKFSNAATQSLTPPGNDDTNLMQDFLEVTTLTYGDDDLLPSVTDFNGNGFKDLRDLANQAADDFVDLDGIAAGLFRDLVLAVRLHSSAPNDLQGDSVNTTITATLQQAPHGSE